MMVRQRGRAPAAKGRGIKLLAEPSQQ